MHATHPTGPYACPRCWRSCQPGLGSVRWWEGLVDVGPSLMCASCLSELRERSELDPSVGGIEVVEIRGTFDEHAVRTGSPAPVAASRQRRRPRRATVEL